MANHTPALLCFMLLWTACTQSGTAPEPSAVVADTASGPVVNGWQEVHTQNGGVMKGELLDGVRQGPWTAYFPDGTVRSRSSYLDGKLHGSTEVFHENGSPYYVGQYNMGKAVGEWRFFDPQGNQIRTAVHDSLGNLLEQR